MKLPTDRWEDLVAAGEGQVFEPMPGRTMNGRLLLEDPSDRDALLAGARDRVEGQQK